jgi:hypothetical protein
MILEIPPQKVNFAIQIKSGISPGKEIIVDHGKLYAHTLPFSRHFVGADSKVGAGNFHDR